MENDSSHIIPLVLIIIILLIILCGRPLIASPRFEWTTGQTERPELGIVREEEEPLLSVAEVQDASSGRDGRLQGVRNTLARLSAEIDWWKNEDARKAEEIMVAGERIATLQRQLSTSVSQNAELQRRYDTLSGDLEGARLFLNTADTFSDSEVIQMLQKLNAELQQTSTFMADRVIDVFKLGPASSNHEPIIMGSDSECIGSTFIRFLWSANDDSDVPMYLQVAFQAYLARYMCRIVSSWTIDEGQNAFISEIYQRLRESERQMICGRWRSLTRLYTLPTCADEPNSIATPIIAGLSYILLAVGCATPQSDIISGLSSMFETKISAAISIAARLNKMIGGVVSGDFEVFVAQPGDAFHEERMVEDIDEDVQRSPNESSRTVLCTSELGLSKRMQSNTGERETTTVIKAKVVLESFLGAEK